MAKRGGWTCRRAPALSTEIDAHAAAALPTPRTPAQVNATATVLARAQMNGLVYSSTEEDLIDLLSAATPVKAHATQKHLPLINAENAHMYKPPCLLGFRSDERKVLLERNDSEPVLWYWQMTAEEWNRQKESYDAAKKKFARGSFISDAPKTRGKQKQPWLPLPRCEPQLW